MNWWKNWWEKQMAGHRKRTFAPKCNAIVAGSPNRCTREPDHPGYHQNDTSDMSKYTHMAVWMSQLTHKLDVLWFTCFWDAMVFVETHQPKHGAVIIDLESKLVVMEYKRPTIET